MTIHSCKRNYKEYKNGTAEKTSEEVPTMDGNNKKDEEDESDEEKTSETETDPTVVPKLVFINMSELYVLKKKVNEEN